MLYIQNSKPLVVCICISDFVTVRLQMFHMETTVTSMDKRERDLLKRERERERLMTDSATLKLTSSLLYIALYSPQ